MTKPTKPEAPPSIERFSAGTFAPEQFDDEQRIARGVTWYTGTAVERYDYWEGEKFYMQLSMEPGAADLSFLNQKGAVLNAHSDWSLEDVIGRVEPGSASMDSKTGGKADLRFSKRAAVGDIWQDVKDGILTSVSVGFTIGATEDITKEGDEFRTILVTKYTPKEISPVPFGADPGAGFGAFSAALHPEKLNRAPGAKEDAMSKQSKTTEGQGNADEPRVTEPKKMDAAVVDETYTAAELAERERKAAAKERVRAKSIRERAESVGLDAEFYEPLIDKGITIEEATDAIFAEKARQTDEYMPRKRIEVTRDGDETFREGCSEALAFRARTVKELTERGREYQTHSLRELAKACLEYRGINTRGWSPKKVVGEAFANSTSDFPYILENTVGKAIQRGFDEIPVTFPAWTTQGTLPDFKAVTRAKLGQGAKFQLVAEDDTMKLGTLGEEKETLQVHTYGRGIKLSRNAVVNDDLSAFNTLGMRLGQQGRIKQEALVYNLLVGAGTGGVGLDLFDGKALYHADHNNYQSSGAAPSEITLDAAFQSMHNQPEIMTDPDATGDSADVLGIRPQFIIVGPALELLTRKLLGPYVTFPVEADPAGGATLGTDAAAVGYGANIYRGLLDIIVAPRMTTAGWHLVASPTMHPTAEWGYLAGEEGIMTETVYGDTRVEGMAVYASMDFYCGILEYRSFYYNDGA